MIWLYIFIFLISFLALFWSGSRIVTALISVARFLGWREFVIAFFSVAVASSLPNLLIGINSALKGVPQLSFGDVVGGNNLVNLTLAVAAAVLIGRTELPAASRMVQNTAVFTGIIAALPLFLVLDGRLGRIDGLILIFAFLFYIFWLFSKEDRFKKSYEEELERIEDSKKDIKEEKKVFERFIDFLKNMGLLVFFLLVLIASSYGIVASATYFSTFFGLALSLVGIFIIGIANTFPEIYFAIASARRKETWMILGNLMGGVIICATLVLGTVALICPIEISNFSPLVIARVFMALAIIFFLVVVRTGQKITRGESVFLLAIYILFIASEFLFGSY